MKFKISILLLLLSVCSFAQENVLKHTVEKGDNIYNISKKYGVKPQAILDANPNSGKILKLQSTLVIPGSSNVSTTTTSIDEPIAIRPTSHEVLAKETLWGISKKYGLSLIDLKKVNPNIEIEGLKIGQLLVIPAPDVTQDITSKTVEELPKTMIVTRKVAARETKYAIAKEFGLTVAELEAQNPSIKTSFPIGLELAITTTVEKGTAYENSKAAKSSENKFLNAMKTLDSRKTIVDTSAIVYNNHSELIDQLIIAATDNIGTRYRTGGTSKSGFDCSGLMYSTFGNFDIVLPRSSIEQSRIGEKISSEEAQKGDLIFFKTNGRRQINHVGMVVDVTDGEIKFVHSSTHGGVIISSTKEGYYQRNFSQINRILK